MTEQEAEAKAEAEYLYPSDRWGLAQRGAFERGAAWERARHSPEWSCPVEGCTLKSLHTHAEFEPNAWSRLVAEERAHQVEVGYDAKHDSEHGLDHLLGWAEDYLRRDRRVEAGALIRAARELAPRVVVAAPPDTDAEPLTNEALWDFANDLLELWNIEDLNPPSLTEQFRDRFVARFGAAQPVQVEVTDEMEEREAKAWLEGAQHVASRHDGFIAWDEDDNPYEAAAKGGDEE